MKVRLLAECPDLLPLIVQWLLNQFGYLNPHATTENALRRLRERLNLTGCPLTFVSFEGDVPTGTASLVESDLDECPDLSPWLAGIVVLPQYRRRGFGKALAHAVTSHARQHGYSKIYLFTPDQQAFFASLGWIECEALSHNDTVVSVMERALND